jgi:hypothetical protein
MIMSHKARAPRCLLSLIALAALLSGCGSGEATVQPFRSCVLANGWIGVVLELDDGGDTDRFINLYADNALLGQTVQAPGFGSVSETDEIACNDAGGPGDPIIAGELVVTGYDFVEDGPTRLRVDATGLVSEQYGELPDAIGIEFTEVQRHTTG